MKKVFNKIKKNCKDIVKDVRIIGKQKGKKAMIQAFFGEIIYKLYEKRKIRKLRMDPPPIVENRMVFETNDDFSDNGRALFDYLISNGYNEKYEMIWLVRDPEKYKEYAVKNVTFIQKFKKYTICRRLEAYKYALTSRYIFYTQAFNWIGGARKEQIFINLWHGCGYKANKNNRKVFFDYCLVPGDIFIKTKMEFFGCTSKKILPMGYPRYDLMLKGSDVARAFKKELLENSSSKKLILWMPTYRHAFSQRLNEETLNNEFNIPIIDDANKLLELNEFCKQKNVLLVIKKHYLQVPYDFGENALTNIIYLENKDLNKKQIQLYEFINCADALISDYSSVAIDYLLLDRQLGFTLDDYEAYTESRGWVFDDPLEYMPGKHIYTMQDFKDYIQDVITDTDLFKQKREKVRKQTHNVCDNYCQRVLDYFDIK